MAPLLAIELMKSPNFELIFEYKGLYYASQFLADKNDIIDFLKGDLEFAFSMKFPMFFSLGFISRFIARYGHDALEGHFCKNGILLKRFNEFRSRSEGKPRYVNFLIVANINLEEIIVYTTEEGKKQRFIRKIYDSFLEFADGDRNVEIRLNSDLPPVSLKNIELYKLQEYNIERLHQELTYEKVINGNYIKVEGNGNIILQNIDGSKITINFNKLDEIKEQLSNEHQSILAVVKENRDKIPAFDFKDVLCEILEQVKSHEVGVLLKEMEKRLTDRFDRSDLLTRKMVLLLENKAIDTARIQLIMRNINRQHELTMIEVGQSIMEHINWAFQEHGKDLENTFHEIYNDLKSTDVTETKLKISVPLLHLLGVELSSEVKLNKFINDLESRF